MAPAAIEVQYRTYFDNDYGHPQFLRAVLGSGALTAPIFASGAITKSPRVISDKE